MNSFTINNVVYKLNLSRNELTATRACYGGHSEVEVYQLTSPEALFDELIDCEACLKICRLLGWQFHAKHPQIPIDRLSNAIGCDIKPSAVTATFG